MTTPGPAWPPVTGWDGHLLLVHATEEERREQLAVWVEASLGAGRRVVYVVDPRPGVPADPLLDVLDEAGVDGAAAIADGTLVVLPASEFYPPGAPEALAAGAVADGLSGVCFSGQATSALATLSAEQYREFERFMGALCRNLPVSTLCQYDVTVPSDWSLAATVDVHLDGGVRHRLLSSAGAGGRLEVVGEVDASDAGLFGTLVDAAGATAGDTLDVDLRGLRWISAAGLRALDRGTAAFCAGGGRVKLHVVPGSPVDRTLRLLDLNLPAGVTLTGG